VRAVGSRAFGRAGDASDIDVCQVYDSSRPQCSSRWRDWASVRRARVVASWKVEPYASVDLYPPTQMAAGLSCSHPGCAESSFSRGGGVNCAASAGRASSARGRVGVRQWNGRLVSLGGAPRSWRAISANSRSGYGAKGLAPRDGDAHREETRDALTRGEGGHRHRGGSRHWSGHALELAKHVPPWW